MPSSLDPAAPQTLEQRSAEVEARSATLWSLAAFEAIAAVTLSLRKGRGARALPPCPESAAMCSERALGPVDFRLGWVAGFRTIPRLRAEDPTALPLSVTHFLWMVILRRHYVTLPLHMT